MTMERMTPLRNVLGVPIDRIHDEIGFAEHDGMLAVHDDDPARFFEPPFAPLVIGELSPEVDRHEVIIQADGGNGQA